MTIDERLVIDEKYVRKFVLDTNRYLSTEKVEQIINEDVAKLNGGVIEIYYPPQKPLDPKLNSFFSYAIIPYLCTKILGEGHHFKADELSLREIKGIMGSRTVGEVEGTEKEYVLRRYDKVA